MAHRQTLAPDLDLLEALARAAVERLPAQFRQYLDGIVMRVDDWPDEETLDEMGAESAYDLLGLYRGFHVGESESVPTGAMPNMIFLYRRPIIDYWAETGESLEHVVTHVLVHEVGHHFGLSDETMERIEAEAEAASG